MFTISFIHYYILIGARILLGNGYNGIEKLYVLTKNNEVSSAVSTVYCSNWYRPVSFCHGDPCSPLVNWSWLEGFNLGEMKTFTIHNNFSRVCKSTQIFFKDSHCDDPQPDVGQTYCAIDSSTLLFAGGRSYNDSLDSCGGYYRPWLLRFPVPKDDSQRTLELPTTASTSSSLICVTHDQPVCPVPEGWIQCKECLPVTVAFHSVTKLKENSVILIGGKDLRKPKKLVGSKEVLMGTLASDKENILWEKLSSLNVGRWFHVTFKIDDVIYVAGGFDDSRKCLSSCEEYSLVTKTWRESNYELPYPLAKAVVEVDSQQKFAIIAGGITAGDIVSFTGEYLSAQYTSKIISFSKEHGFREVEKFELKKRSHEIAIRF